MSHHIKVFNNNLVSFTPSFLHGNIYSHSYGSLVHTVTQLCVILHLPKAMPFTLIRLFPNLGLNYGLLNLSVIKYAHPKPPKASRFHLAHWYSSLHMRVGLS